jgi:predicted nucleic acid-binding protein
MKQYFDTSVLIAAFVEDEIHHRPCAAALSNSDEGFILDHGVTECFSILTGGRGLSIRLSPASAVALLERNVIGRLTVVSLTPEEKFAVLRNCQRLSIRGASIYDAMHLAAARKAGSEAIFTLNLSHFTACAPDLAGRVRIPAA